MGDEFKGSAGKWRYRGGVVSTETELVCNVFGFDTNEKKANGKLISKAPEMLGMLIKAAEKLAEFRSILGGHEDTYPGSPFDEMSNTSKYIEVQISKLLKEATCTNK